MKFSILTLFPQMFSGPFDSSIIKRAKEQHKISIDLVNIRNFSTDKYKSVDDHPYGGGPGMILRVDVLDLALKSVKTSKPQKIKETIVLLDPIGTIFTQRIAREYVKLDHLILICGHYEGIDERVRKLVDKSISIGEYVLTGGEIPSMVMVDSISRLIPGVLKKPEAVKFESFSPTTTDTKSIHQRILEYPQYTRPESYGGQKVPDILLSGNHKKIALWRIDQSNSRTTKTPR